MPTTTSPNSKPALELGRDTAERLREAFEQSDLGRRARDAAYTVVGLGVMGAQRANVATRQAFSRLGSDEPRGLDVDALRTKTKDLSETARKQFLAADGLVQGAISRIEEALSPLEVKLPGSARETVDRARAAGRELHAQVRTLVAGADDSAADGATEDTGADDAATEG